jgi:hypothetical protein
MNDCENLPGQQVMRNKRGQFTMGTTLSSEEATRRGSMKNKGSNQEITDIAEAFLQEAGYSEDNPPSSWIRKAAEECARAKTMFAANMILFQQMTLRDLG